MGKKQTKPSSKMATIYVNEWSFTGSVEQYSDVRIDQKTSVATIRFGVPVKRQIERPSHRDCMPPCGPRW